jgi:hypothetical protein
MRRSALLVLAGAAIAVPAAAVGADDRGPPLVAVERSDGAKWLRLVDPVTLRPESRRIRGFREAFTGARSPDGRHFAVGSNFDRSAAIRVIDLERRRSERIIELGRQGPVLVEWPTRDRIVAISGRPYTQYEISVVDPFGAKVRARHPFRGWLLSHQATPTGVAVLLGPERRLGAARLLVAEAPGGVRSITLGRIEAGGNIGRARRPRYRQPALAVDRTRGRAYVVAARDRPLVASVELSSGQVEYHEPAVPPAARAAKGNADIRWREASWLGSDSIAVTGFRTRPERRGERFPPPDEPYGVRLIDTSDWTIRTLAEKANQIQVTGDRLLAHGTTWSRGWRRSESTGLLGFDGEGNPLFTRFRGQEVLLAGATDDHAFVWVRATKTLHVLDLGDGHTIRKAAATRGRDVPILLSP